MALPINILTFFTFFSMLIRMSAQIIDGRSIAAQILKELKIRVENLSSRGFRPGLAVILIGDDPASVSYVTAKEKDCESIGIHSRDIRLPKSTSEAELTKLIINLNQDDDIHGILLQLPLPLHIDEERVIESISPLKDVDGFHPMNLGNLILNRDAFLPCTPHGIVKILQTHGTVIEGADVVIIGRSRIVGAPLANLLFRKASGANATVTICHSRTVDLAEKTRTADILVAATGQPGTIRGDMVKPGATIIDVGVNRIEDKSARKGYRLVGDVIFNEVVHIAAAITPVPGGVGPMTRAMLLWNTLKSAERFHRE